MTITTMSCDLHSIGKSFMIEFFSDPMIFSFSFIITSVLSFHFVSRWIFNLSLKNYKLKIHLTQMK